MRFSTASRLAAAGLAVPAAAFLLGASASFLPAGELGAAFLLTTAACALIFRNRWAAVVSEAAAERGRVLAARHACTRALAESEGLAQAAPRILRAAGEAFEWDAGVFWRVDLEAGMLHGLDVWQGAGVATPHLAQTSRTIPMLPGSGIAGRVWSMHSEVWIADLGTPSGAADPESARADGLVSACGFPVQQGAEVMAVLVFYSRRHRSLDPPFVSMMLEIGREIGQFMDRERAQFALRLSEVRFRTVLNNVVDGIVTFGEDGRIEWANPAAVSIFGWSFAELHGRPVQDLAVEPFPEQPGDATPFPRRRGDTRRVGIGREVTGRRKDGREFPMDLAVRSFFLGDRRMFTAITRDITERKRAQELLIAKDAAERASREKSVFLAQMTHELRTPLNAIIGFANVLLKNKAGNLGPQEILYAERILHNGEHQLKLINSGLDLSKIEAGRMELVVAPVAVDRMVREVAAQFEAEALRRAIELRVEVPENVHPLDTDGDRLRQILLNLMANAVKFTERGFVAVRLEVDPRTRYPRTIEVVDTGIGIPPDRQDTIFEAFQQGDRSITRRFGGTGLGLTISRELAERLGGRIVVHSRPGEGSTFRIVLPMPRDGRHTALVIDGDRAARASLVTQFEELGWRVRAAGACEEGLCMARAERPDLVALDPGSPGVDGLRLVQDLQGIPGMEGVAVVVMGAPDPALSDRLPSQVDYLAKPIRREDLVPIVQRAMRGG